MTLRAVVALTLFIALGALTGCAPTVLRNYSGPMKTPNDVALVYLEPDARLSILPGQWLEGPLFIEMLPGKYEVSVGLHEEYGEGKYWVVESGMHSMELTVAAGHRYWFEVSRQRLAPGTYRGLLTRLSSADTDRWLQARANGADIQTYEPR